MNRFQVTLDELKKIVRDPVMISTIILTIIALSLFILLPIYSVLKGSFVSDEGRLTLQYLTEAMTSEKNLSFNITQIYF